MFDFGVLQEYVDDDHITDIDSNSKTVYVSHVVKGEIKVLNLEEGYLESLLNRLCNCATINNEFNFENPILNGVIDGLRIHATHASYTTSGYAINIRKNPIKLVISEEIAKRTKYCNAKVFAFLKACAKAKMSVIFGGEVGTGKTQLMKTMLSYIDKNLGIVLISDIDEMRMLELYPDRNIRQYIVNDMKGYKETTASVLRDNATYVCFQEVLDNAVDSLLLVLSSCSRVTCTMHLKNALLMPQRMIQLSDNKNDMRLLSTIHDYIQVCIVPCKEKMNGRIRRFIGEIAVFWNDEDGLPQKKLIYEQRGDEVIMKELPAYFKDFFAKQRIALEWGDSIEKI